MNKYIKQLEKMIEDEKMSGSCYISVTIPLEERQKEIEAIKFLLEEYKKLNNKEDIICLIL